MAVQLEKETVSPENESFLSGPLWSLLNFSPRLKDFDSLVSRKALELAGVTREVVPLFDAEAAYRSLSPEFQDELALLLRNGVHPFVEAAVFNPYTDTLDQRDFRNVGRHSLAVAHAAEVLGTELFKEGLVSMRDVRRMISRALIHDADKRFEIMKADAVRAGLRDQEQVPRRKRFVTSALSDPLAEPGSETGYQSLEHFLTVDIDGSVALTEGLWVEKVVHLADDMTSEMRFVTPADRIELSNFRQKYPKLFLEGLAVSDENGILRAPLHVPLYGAEFLGSYAAVQLYVANSLCAEFKQAIAPFDTRRSDVFIKDLLNLSLQR